MGGRKKKKVRTGRNKGLSGVREAEGIVLTSVLGLSAAAGLALLVRHFYKKFLQNQAQKKSLTEGNPSSYATQLYMAMGNEHFWSKDDTDNVLRLIREIPTRKLYNGVADMYNKNYNSNLSADLEKRLSPADYITATQLISAKA